VTELREGEGRTFARRGDAMTGIEDDEMSGVGICTGHFKMKE
jgi:hypothetical protein